MFSGDDNMRTLGRVDFDLRVGFLKIGVMVGRDELGASGVV